LEGLDARPNEQDVLSIAAALCPIEDTRDPFWEYAARGVIASMLYYVLSYLPKEE
jgi:type IV secretion system protein VirD4